MLPTTPLHLQVAYLFLLAIPVACISWTVTHEEVFREPREYCIKKSKECNRFYKRKFFYLFTCEYCFSHYTTAAILLITHYQLAYTGWKGYFIAGFSMVWIANTYMSLFGLLRMGIKKEGLEAKVEEKKLEEQNNSQ